MPTDHSAVQLVRVFDRARTDHRWRQALNETHVWSTGSDHLTRVTTRAVAENWAIDGRVKASREDSMLARPAFDAVPDQFSWPEQRGKYHVQHIRIAELSVARGLAPDTYLDANAESRIAGNSISPHARLCRVASFSSVLRQLARNSLPNASSHRRKFFDKFGVELPSILSHTASQLSAAIDVACRALSALGPDRVKEAAGWMTDTLGSAQGPWWATFYHELIPAFRSRDWLLVCQRLGLGHLATSDWLMVFVYEVNMARPLYRPTCAEANESPWHYPVPGNSHFDFGITMSLNPGGRLCQGVREVLHRPLNGPMSLDACTGDLIRLDTDVVDRGSIHEVLPQLRRRHREWLRDEHADSTGWLAANPEWPE